LDDLKRTKVDETQQKETDTINQRQSKSQARESHITKDQTDHLSKQYNNNT